MAVVLADEKTVIGKALTRLTMTCYASLACSSHLYTLHENDQGSV